MVEQGRFQQLLDQTQVSVVGLLTSNAASVDQAVAIPAENLAAISELGLYSMVVPSRMGGLGLEPAQVRHIMRLLGGACGATAFSFAQHHSLVGAVARSENVRLRFDDLVVPERDVIAVQPYTSWQSYDRRISVRPNPLCLGIGDKALELLTQKGADTDGHFAASWTATVARAEAVSLLVDQQAGDVAQIAAVRSECILAVQRLTTALLAAVSGLGATIEHPAQRLARESLFYVVQAQSADGKAATLATLRRSTQAA